MPNETKGVYYTLNEAVPVIWQDLFKARKFDANAKPKFGATFLLPKGSEDLKQIEGIVKAVAFSAGFPITKYPLKDGDVLAQQGKGSFLEGHVVFRTSTSDDARPPILRFAESETSLVTFEEHNRLLAQPRFYAGVLCGGSFGFSAYQGMGGCVTAYLNEIVSLGIGEAIQDRGGDGTKKHESLLKYVGRVSRKDPTVGMAPQDGPSIY
jgi:hypothetical protein